MATELTPISGDSRLARAHAGARREKGQAMVEFAIALPVLMLLIIAIIDFGVTLNHWSTLTDATRAAGRVAATCRFTGYPGNVQTAYNNAATDLPGHGPPAISGSCTQGQTISVTGQYPYKVRVFGLTVYSGNLSATSAERVE